MLTRREVIIVYEITYSPACSMFVSYRVSTAGQLWWPRHGFMAIIPKLQSTGARSTNHQNRFRNIFHDIFGDIKKCQKNFQIFYLGKKMSEFGFKNSRELAQVKQCHLIRPNPKMSEKVFKNITKTNRIQKCQQIRPRPKFSFGKFVTFLTIFYFLGTVFWHFWTPELGLLFADFF